MSQSTKTNYLRFRKIQFSVSLAFNACSPSELDSFSQRLNTLGSLQCHSQRPLPAFLSQSDPLKSYRDLLTSDWSLSRWMRMNSGLKTSVIFCHSGCFRKGFTLTQPCNHPGVLTITWCSTADYRCRSQGWKLANSSAFSSTTPLIRIGVYYNYIVKKVSFYLNHP